MMTKKRTSSIAALKLLLAIPVTLFVFLAISGYKDADMPPSQLPLNPVTSDESGTFNNETTALPEETPYTTVEKMPVFKGGDAALLNYISRNVSYPESAKENNTQGRIIVRFCVNSDGTISQVNVIKGVSPDLDNEAVRVVKTLPAFEPGMNGGKAVPVWYMVPITFALK